MTDQSLTFDQFLGLLSGVRRTGPGRAMALCAGHDDHDPSLEVWEEKDGGLGLKCYAGCTRSAVLAAMGLDWRAVHGSRSVGAREKSRDTAIAYDYVDERGSPLFQAVRFTPKGFAQRRPAGGGGWIWNMRGMRRVLYRLPRVIEAARRGLTVLVLEGEKDVHTAEDLGFVATTSPGGAGRWRADYAEALSGARVVIIPDNDPPGQKHAREVARSCVGRALSVKILNLPELPTKGDLTDWVEAFHFADELHQLIDACPEWDPSPDPGDTTSSATAEREGGGGPSPLGFPRSDAGNAELLASIHSSSLRYVHRHGRWREWVGTHWADDNSDRAEQLTVQAMRGRARRALELPDAKEVEREIKWALSSESAKRVRDCLSLAQGLAEFATQPEDYDADPWVLNVLNGTIDLRRGVLRRHRREDLLSKVAPVEYVPGAECPRWAEFLAQVFADDAHTIDFVQRAVGYGLTGVTKEQCLFLLWGLGANGKSTLLSLLRRLLGTYLRVAEFATFSFEREKRAPVRDDVAELPGARLVTASEPTVGVRLSEGLLKQVTGSDPVKARRLYGRPFEFVPQFKLWLSANRRPAVRDTSDGFWRRVHLIPFTVSFRGREDRELPEKLAAELPGILNWALAGCLEWQTRGLDPPEAVRVATADYRQNEDILGAFFVDCTTDDPGAVTPFADLYARYRKWCEEERGGESAVSRKAFGEALDERGFAKKRLSGGTRGRQGVRVV